jgi:hypothetical protein
MFKQHLMETDKVNLVLAIAQSKKGIPTKSQRLRSKPTVSVQ